MKAYYHDYAKIALKKCLKIKLTFSVMKIELILHDNAYSHLGKVVTSLPNKSKWEMLLQVPSSETIRDHTKT